MAVQQVMLGIGPTGPAPAIAHRAWRVLITLPDGSTSFCGMTELEFREAPGSADWTIDAVEGAASSEINTENRYENARDDSLTTAWLSATAGSSWIRFGFDSNQVSWKKCTQVAIRGAWNAPDASPRNFQIQWSDNLTTWTTARTVTGETGWTGASDLRLFDVP